MLRILERIAKRQELDYDVYVMFSSIHTAWNDITEARKAFESALRIEPERDEAKTALTRLGGLP